MQGFARSVSYVPSEFSTTTTGNIDNLDFVGADLIRMNNATLSTIRGLVAGTAGQRVTVVSIGAGQVDLAHQNANSTAANRLINTATSTSTPLTAGIGFATYQYDGTTARWRLVHHEQGAALTWTPIDSSGAGLTFGVPAFSSFYIRVGNLVYISMEAVYPATANTSNAVIGGFPFTNANAQSAFAVGQTDKGTSMLVLRQNGTVIDMYTSDGVTALRNVDLSAKTMRCAGCYQATA